MGSPPREEPTSPRGRPIHLIYVWRELIMMMCLLQKIDVNDYI